MNSERKDTIFDAVEYLVLECGPDAVTMRAVARQAGVSVRLVQYYGSTKAELLEGALTRLSAKSLAQWRGLLRQDPRGPAVVLREFLLTALPTTERRRRFHRFGVGLETLAITEPDDFGRIYAAHITAVSDALAEALEPQWGAAAPQLATEAIAFGHGLGTLLMTGHVTARQARASVESFLDRLPSPPETGPLSRRAKSL